MSESVFDTMTDIDVFQKAMGQLRRAPMLPEGSEDRILAMIVFDACMVELARREAAHTAAAIRRQ